MLQEKKMVTKVELWCGIRKLWRIWPMRNVSI